MNVFGSLLGGIFSVVEEPSNLSGIRPGGYVPMSISPEVNAMLRSHGRAVTFGWRNRSFGPFPSMEEADSHWADVLEAEGYIEPKWYQLSRRSEKRPSKRALEILMERRAKA